MLKLPDPHLWTAGERVDEDMFNSYQYANGFLASPPEIQFAQTAPQSLTISVWNAITFDTVITDDPDPDNSAWDAAHPTRLYCRVPGWYDIYWAVYLDAVAGTTRRSFQVVPNGGSTSSGWGLCDHNNVASVARRVRGYTDNFLNAGDYIELYVRPDTAVSTASGAPSTDWTTLQIRWYSM